MAFNPIDLEKWERKEYYLHFMNEVRCAYSATVNLDITNLKGRRLYPAMIWLLTQTVNLFPEFRTALTDEGLGIYDIMHPLILFSIVRRKHSLTYGRNSIRIIDVF